jgi:hypothetical protein
MNLGLGAVSGACAVTGNQFFKMIFFPKEFL